MLSQRHARDGDRAPVYAQPHRAGGDVGRACEIDVLKDGEIVASDRDCGAGAGDVDLDVDGDVWLEPPVLCLEEDFLVSADKLDDFPHAPRGGDGEGKTVEALPRPPGENNIERLRIGPPALCHDGDQAEGELAPPGAGRGVRRLVDNAIEDIDGRVEDPHIAPLPHQPLPGVVGPLSRPSPRRRRRLAGRP